MLRLLLALFTLCICSTAIGEVFYKTSFFIEQAAEDLSWRSLGFGEARLYEAVAALTGDSFATRPPEWHDYFDTTSFEDEDRKCLNDASHWYLVAGRLVPFSIEPLNEKPQLRLTFQPFCSEVPDRASDTAIQIVLESSNSSFNSELLDFVRMLRSTSASAKFENAGFIATESMRMFSDMPYVVGAREHLQMKVQISRLKTSDLRESSMRWVASLPGQLDWVFGILKKTDAQVFEPVPIELKAKGEVGLLNLGYFDFLPLFLREPFRQLPTQTKESLAPFHVVEDLHSGRATAKRVLETDLRVSNPALTHHQQTSCIQCHSAQERLERATNFLRHGGAKEFGYFFIGLGLIQNKPYVSWRSIQESRFNDQRIKKYLSGEH